ncbi:MAG: thioesterase domain-containing protein [Bacteroidales bacterium]|nr:thioesterase domain-containing protein [Bacteroidales bacterium]
MQKIKLFCFPYAGGSSLIFREWKNQLKDYIDLCPIELAGHGKRINEPLYSDLSEAIDDVLRIVVDELQDGSQYALYGHSLGSVISYYLNHKLQINNYQLPLHIFFSGRTAPHNDKKRTVKYHLLSTNEFCESVEKLGGMPKDFFSNIDLVNLYLPIVRNDFKLAETDLYPNISSLINCDISVFLGKNDNYSPLPYCTGWEAHTNMTCSYYIFQGNHFFINDNFKKILRIINNTLEPHC